LSLEFDDLVDDGSGMCMHEKPLHDLVAVISRSPNYATITEVFSRLLAAKPHSADVEQLISVNNVLKSDDRFSLRLSTENMYLFIHYSLPALTDWDPKPTVLHWLKDKERRVRKRQKGKQQSYFKRVFPEAGQSKTSELEDSDSD